MHGQTKMTAKERLEKRRRAVLGHAKQRCVVCRVRGGRCSEYARLLETACRDQDEDFRRSLETEVMLVSRYS